MARLRAVESSADPLPGPRARVCLFGGTFDPPHRAHRAVVEACHAQLGLDRLIVLPSGHHPFKGDGSHASGADRVALCRVAFADLAWVQIDEREVQRAAVSYTVNTLRAFRAALGAEVALYFLIGSDNVSTLPLWRQHHEALALAQFVVVPRAQHPMPPPEFDRLDLTATEKSALLGHVLSLAPSGVSSTEIRRRLATGDEVAEFVQPEVLAEIERRRLYRP